MGKPRLICRRDSGTGLPRLESRGIPLGDQERRQLELEITQLFEWLVQRGDGDTIVFETPVRTLPHPTEFRIRKSSRGRCPDLTFEPICDSKVAAAPVVVGEVERTQVDDWRNRVFTEMAKEPKPRRSGSEPTQQWQDHFLAAAEQFVSPAQRMRLPSADRVAIEYVLSELSKLGRERSVNMTPVLLAGYFSLGHEMCVQFDPERTGLYQLASRALDRVYAQTIKASQPTTAAETSSRDKPGSRRFGGLCRLLREWLEKNSAI
jgi:hypothetical protein